MKNIIFIFALVASFLFTSDIFGQTNPNYHYVKPHYRSNGTYVEGYYRTNPNNTKRDNYSTYPNVNPHTGKTGTVKPQSYYNSPSYTQPKPTYKQPTYTQPKSNYNNNYYRRNW